MPGSSGAPDLLPFDLDPGHGLRGISPLETDLQQIGYGCDKMHFKCQQSPEGVGDGPIRNQIRENLDCQKDKGDQIEKGNDPVAVRLHRFQLRQVGYHSHMHKQRGNARQHCENDKQIVDDEDRIAKLLVKPQPPGTEAAQRTKHPGEEK